jgi:hypothetical protein
VVKNVKSQILTIVSFLLLLALLGGILAKNDSISYGIDDTEVLDVSSFESDAEGYLDIDFTLFGTFVCACIKDRHADNQLVFKSQRFANAFSKLPYYLAFGKLII